MTHGYDFLSSRNNEAYINSTVLLNYMNLLIHRGADKGKVEKTANIKLEELTEPDKFFPLSHLFTLEKSSSLLTGDKSIGLKMGLECLPDGSQSGLIGHIASHCSIVGEGFKQAIRYSNLMSNCIQIDLKEMNDLAEFHYKRSYAEFYSIQSIEMSLANAATLLKAKDQSFQIEAAFFNYSPPDYLDLYHEVFGKNIYFDQKENKIVFPSSTLNIPNDQAQPYLHSLLIDRGLKILKEIESSTSFIGKVRKHILDNLPTGKIGIDHISYLLNMSRQSMYRKLKEEGTTFQNELDDLRKNLVRDYTSSSDYNMSEIAFLLGFSEVSSFYRAYKRWFGSGPGH